jgi:flagellar basal-body rod protein FlgF
MNTSLNTIGTAMTDGYTDRLAIISDNLANSSMPGYRRTCVSQASFDMLLSEEIQKIFGSSTESEEKPTIISTDFSQGPLKTTGRALDFAITGQGFFAISQNNREYYTRNGHFEVDSEGNLITTGGLRVQGEAGDMTIPSGVSASTITVDGDGTLYAGDNQIGKLRLVEFSDTKGLSRVGPGIFEAGGGNMVRDIEDTIVSNKMLEGSNANVFEEMVELIECMRSFEACQKMVKTDDSTRAEMIKQLQVP